MINDQVIQAFKTLLAYVETTDARSQAALELLEEAKLVDQEVIHARLAEVASRKKQKYDALRTQIESILKEKADF